MKNVHNIYVFKVPTGLNESDRALLEKRLMLTIQYHSNIDVETAVSAYLLDDEGMCSLENDASELLIAFSCLLSMQILSSENGTQNKILITEDVISIVFNVLTSTLELFDGERLHTFLQSSNVSFANSKKRKISDKGTAAKVSSLLSSIVSLFMHEFFYEISVGNGNFRCYDIKSAHAGRALLLGFWQRSLAG